MAQPEASPIDTTTVPVTAPAADSASAKDVAQQLSNPVANLISVPVQVNYDEESGPGGDGERVTVNLQPVIPFSLNEDWNLITRTIVPIVYQNGDASSFSDDSTFGLGDTVMSLFFSPKEPVDGVTWGLGPVLYLPTATEDELGANQWGIGPSGVVLKVDGPWTYGVLVNHIWSLGETEDYDSFFIDRPDVNNTFIQPFASYNVGDGWTVTAAAEATYNWESDEWTIPVGVFPGKLLNLGGQLINVSGGARYYLDAPDNGPEWGLRLQLTFVFPQS